MNRLIVVGSPRTDGRCAQLADEIFESCIADYPEDEVALVPLALMDVQHCKGCAVCPQSAEVDCIIDDDMAEIREALDAADQLIMVCPVYFASAPATFKAFLDRLQPYFWSGARYGDLRPATLHIIGEGHDPFGFGGLITTVQSACFTAGFSLDEAMNWVGKISDTGEILGEPEIIEVAWPDAMIDEAFGEEEPECADLPGDQE